ncbi:MAG: dihydroorotate dehydrogenase electron transfer subunit [Defluviitaleaceae bacterium]|nr:dihydroorotate dehydrogenase electron transfer subunit [Defluviitaleaceae bacterium]
MKKYLEAAITSTQKISDKIYKMDLSCPEIAKSSEMGQFLNIYLDKGEMILPRPISIQDVDKDKGVLSIMYLIAGKGTAYMATLPVGYKLNIAGPLGNGFVYKNYKKIALIGGGIGVPPLYCAAKAVLGKYPDLDVEIRAYIGFRDIEFVNLEGEFKALGVKTLLTTDNGSYGIKGNALEAFKNDDFAPDCIYTCGPYGMLRAVANYAMDNNISCQVSMEERMGCGIGACVGCAIAIKKGEDFTFKKVCKDGPVFEAQEVLWQ